MSWPEARLPVEGLHGRILKSEDYTVVFMAADLDVVVPMHRHGAQWGVVLDGTMELKIHGECVTYRRGDSHYIPTDVDHEAILYAGWRGMYVFRRGKTEQEL
jgi:quercetin dioxygenase-like cupin family protein